jgi:hypothetical protein
LFIYLIINKQFDNIFAGICAVTGRPDQVLYWTLCLKTHSWINLFNYVITALLIDTSLHVGLKSKQITGDERVVMVEFMQVR